MTKSQSREEMPMISSLEEVGHNSETGRWLGVSWEVMTLSHLTLSMMMEFRKRVRKILLIMLINPIS